jgi:hypothetical protein
VESTIGSVPQHRLSKLLSTSDHCYLEKLEIIF